uniref:Transmembrane protein 100 n=1 Tax=Neolamprologus brichardi TaxID=32507 RepID=A0A3Q4HAB9_NEOBR
MSPALLECLLSSCVFFSVLPYFFFFPPHLLLSIFRSSLCVSSCRHMLALSTESNNNKTSSKSLPTLERLAQATGGTEKSWYRCVFPFGVISLVIGMAGTGVTFTFNTLLQTKVVSVALLCVGVMMLLVAAVCWRFTGMSKLFSECLLLATLIFLCMVHLM